MDYYKGGFMPIDKEGLDKVKKDLVLCAGFLNAHNVDSSALQTSLEVIEQQELKEKLIAKLQDMVVTHKQQSEKYRGALIKVGNAVGAPVTSYVPEIERQEWRERALKISDIIQDALKDK